jgi:hypothetical protein
MLSLPPKMQLLVLVGCGLSIAGAAAALDGCTTAPDVHQSAQAQSTPCVTCHYSAYATTQNPKHIGLLPNTCETCHATSEWIPAAFTQHSMFFPLVGVHTTTPCASCHTTDYNAGDTPTACVGCHMTDYTNSTYTGHNCFPTTCDTCHTPSGWIPATGVHPEALFPITTGSHANPGIACADCHSPPTGRVCTPVAGANTDCVHCHLGAHLQAAIAGDAVHTALGAAYTSAAAAKNDAGAPSTNFCLGCHAKG